MELRERLVSCDDEVKYVLDEIIITAIICISIQ